MRPNKQVWPSSQAFNGATPKMSLRDKAFYELVMEQRMQAEKQKITETLSQNINITPVSTDYVNKQYARYNYLGENKEWDQAKVIDFITNTPAWASVWFESYKGLDHVFHLKIGNYEGRSYVVSDIWDSPKYQSLSPEDKAKYFYHKTYSDGTTRVEVKIGALKDEEWNHIEDIAQNLDKLPESVRIVLEPYLVKMDLLLEGGDEDCNKAVATHILGIKDYDKNNREHEQRAMAATDAMREFYGWRHTGTVKNGSRRFAGVRADAACRGYGRDDDGVYGLVLWD